MRSKNILVRLAVLAVMLLPISVLAQSSSINAFSPYTFYGLGDLATPGPAYLRAMGGAGVAFRSPLVINYLNPAANSAIRQQTFLFNFGMEGQNFYDKSATASNSYNTFNVSEVAVQFPLAKNLGFSFSMNPYSSVGYRIEQKETDPTIIANLGDVTYQYQGEGNITQFKAGVGMQVFKNFSVGAEMIYYLGNLDRSYNTLILPITQSGNYNNMSGSDNEFVSKINAGFGFQYAPYVTDKRALTIGGTYTLGATIDSKIDRYIHSNNIMGDTVLFSTKTSEVKIPGILSLGASYATYKLSVNADYVFQNWGDANNHMSYETDSKIGVAYTNTNTFKIGAEYTPNRLDVRNYYKRITYRVGFRYAQHYLKFGGQDIADKAVTIGFGIPIKLRGTTNVNLGFELGERGTTQSNLIKEKYFKFSVGLSLFGEDYWFVKHKYD